MRLLNAKGLWRIVLPALLLVPLAGCHGDTNEGGGTEHSHAGTTTNPAGGKSPASVPTPPSADRVDPNSPQAVLDGTSTTTNAPQKQQPSQAQH